MRRQFGGVACIRSAADGRDGNADDCGEDGVRRWSVAGGRDESMREDVQWVGGCFRTQQWHASWLWWRKKRCSLMVLNYVRVKWGRNHSCPLFARRDGADGNDDGSVPDDDGNCVH